jgi:cell wall-associated NlpC family hydrolase
VAALHSRTVRRAVSAFASLAVSALLLGNAYADPVYPSQNQVDQAQQDVQNRKNAVAPVQAQLDQAQQQLDTLDRQAQIAAEQYDAATVRLQEAQQSAARAASAAVVAEHRLAEARADLGRLAAAAYRDQNGIGAISLLLESDGPDEIATSTHLLIHQATDLKATVRAADRAKQDADAAKAAADASVRARQAAQAQVAQAAQRAQAAVAAEQSQVAAISARRDQLLAELAAAERISVQLEQQRQQGLAEEAARRAALAAAAQHRYGTAPGYDGSAAGRALAFAYAQLGKPYDWGATGPDSFDCSGLTMRAWEAAGVDLPHYAAFQYQASHPIGYSDLRPGDLLFWATDPSDSDTIYHEAIYIGGQQMIQAPRTGENVEVSSMWMWGPIQFYARPD